MTAIRHHLDPPWTDITEALSDANARRFDGNDNFKKCLTLQTCVVGPDRHEAAASTFVFEAKIPRSAVNNLMLSSTWCTHSRAEAAAFLRQLADLMERP